MIYTPKKNRNYDPMTKIALFFTLGLLIMILLAIFL